MKVRHQVLVALVAIPGLLLTSLVFMLPAGLSSLSPFNCKSSQNQTTSVQVALGPSGVTVRGKPLAGDQNTIAQEIIGQGQRRGLSNQDITVALMTGYQESGLRNLNYGDQDSVGVFQQRPSQGWGTVEQILHVPYAVGKFYDRLEKIKDRDSKEPLDLALEVQNPSRAAYESPENKFMDWLPLAVGLIGSIIKGAEIVKNVSTSFVCDRTQLVASATGSDAEFASVGTCPAGQATRVGKTPDGASIQLCSVGGIEVEAGISAQANAMLLAAKAEGIVLGGSGYRSNQRQIELREQNCGPSQYDIYQKPSGQCSPPTAIPGTSEHEVGHAMDLTYQGPTISSHSSPAWIWLNQNAGRFGFKNLPSEPWHWSTTGH